MSTEPREAASIKDDGWRQGSVLPDELAKILLRDNRLPWDSSPDDILIVISHDCDITNASFVSEPYVELLRLKQVPRRDGNLDWGKNPRRYQFVDHGGPPVVFETSVHDRARVPRNLLIGYQPNAAMKVDDETRSRLCRWIAARYVRAAFPDAFNDRIAPAVTQLRTAFKSDGENLTGIYLILVDEELPQTEDYQVVLFATMLDEHYRDHARRTAAQGLLDRIEAIFAGCSGVSFGTTELRSESEISLHDMRKLKRWDFDDLSLRQGQVEDLPPNP